ncbi:cysteine desulfurase [Hyphomicrobium nitrativorans NL23]|uniref:cysteine desulfurase n=1 Tax=Hyphomicrobium nitrativorans NL23 TaxID=1029756 RepID=V5SGP5_9HYPH|nr:family 2A encapsulin nanocompartment cargo protein cysteine desulfurase [Hyphomicrobium nitrativorans]AHB49210.1 cysteine desulfurase [Hyphomicrobium nitrativorans NL23]
MSTANLGLPQGPTDLDALAAAAGSHGGGGLPPPGLPDPDLLTRMANAFFAATPGEPLPSFPSPEAPTVAGPSFGGVGASPTGVAGAVPNPVAATSEAPSAPSPVPVAPTAFSVMDLSGTQTPASPSLPSLPSYGAASPSAPGIGISPSVSLPTADPLDALALQPLINGAHPSLPSGIDTGSALNHAGTISTPPSDAGGGTSVAGAQTGADQPAPPQPPPANPPAPVLVDTSGISTPPSGGLGGLGGYPIEIPFQKELDALLAPLAVSSVPAVPAVPGLPTDTGLYFLDGVSIPGQAHVSGAGAAPFHQSELQSAHPAFDIHAIRRDFPILSETVNGRPLIWFDNAATTQKPKAVIDRISYFYEHENSNIHRAAHELAARATDAYEGARQKVAHFLGASGPEEIIFTRGATEAINLVAATYGQQHIGPGDEIVITNLEHHANVVPWQLLCLAKGAKLRVAPVDDHGALLLDEFNKLLTNRTKLVAFTQVSNALGTITPAKAIVEMAHRVGAKVLVDGAQSVSHMKVNVQELDADFFVFSGHKLFAPTGIGALYAKKALMDSLPPYQSGGNMIRDVTYERTEIHASPQRFEAGTGNIADAVGLGAAIDYVERIGMENIARYEHSLLVYATERLLQIPNLRIIGTAPEKASVISLVIKGVPSEEVGSRLNKYGIAVRSGHHCAQPILRRFGQETTVRPSFAFYNTCGEIDVLVSALEDIQAETGLVRT